MSFSFENSDFTVFKLPVPRIIDPFGHKRCQKKRKYMDNNLLQEFIQKFFVVQGGPERSRQSNLTVLEGGLDSKYPCVK